AAVLLAAVTSRWGVLTWWGSILYVAGRIVYVPLYAAGIPYLRTVVWFVAISGLFMVIAGCLV
ncbi:MAG: hypothetical protein RL701_7703, partial [Pseudomonadota bacterium]